MDLRIIYNYSYQYLLVESAKYVSKEKVDEFISTPDVKNCTDLSSAYELLLEILQDFNRYPKVIKYSERKLDIKRILHGYDFQFISQMTPEDLCESFKSEFGFDKNVMWMKYCKGVISGAAFMLQFSDYHDLRKTFDSFISNDLTREALPMLLSSKIYNMGFAIACNWLKELGYYQYPKPDVHTKEICDALHLVSKKDDIEYFEAMIRIAKEASVDAYKVDKVWWLICTGNFYRYNIQLPFSRTLKSKFISALNNEFGLMMV